eukprot:11298713-Ditylum_brightwellii.AAC.1
MDALPNEPQVPLKLVKIDYIIIILVRIIEHLSCHSRSIWQAPATEQLLHLVQFDGIIVACNDVECRSCHGNPLVFACFETLLQLLSEVNWLALEGVGEDVCNGAIDLQKATAAREKDVEENVPYKKRRDKL